MSAPRILDSSMIQSHRISVFAPLGLSLVALLWSEPLKWHTKLGRERKHSGEKAMASIPLRGMRYSPTLREKLAAHGLDRYTDIRIIV
jgi:hypothetical protein